MKEYSVELVGSLEVNNTLGEGIIWNNADGAVWWTDIQESKLYRYHLASKEIQSWSTPERVGCFGFVESGKIESGKIESGKIESGWRLIVAFASGFAYYDLENGAVEWLARPEEDVPGNRFNDGRVDRQGRFWAGTMVESNGGDQNSQLGALYCVDQDGSCHRRAQGIRISNGLCWSPDSRLMYHADSPFNKMYVYDFDAATGAINNRRLFAETDPGCHPDGATVDRDGYLYSAQWGGSRIVRYSPEGEIDGIIKVPVSKPTCVAFGGDNMELLFVTTAKEGLSDEELSRQPQAGNLLIYQTGFNGLVDPLFVAAK